MQLIEFDRTQDIPIVEALIKGPRSSQRVRLVFDTGSAVTQLDTGMIEDIGYSAADAEMIVRVEGATGEPQEGYLVPVKSLVLFGIQFPTHQVAVYDFDNFAKHGIDGLLGFDVIKQLHLEMIGPEGSLKIFNT